MSERHARDMNSPKAGKRISPRYTRREMLKYAGAGAGALGFSSVLAACQKKIGGSAGGGEVDIDARIAEIYQGEPVGEVDFANWPLYIDQGYVKDLGKRWVPSLYKFQKQTGIEVNYRGVIQGNASFYAEILPALEQGADTGWDMMVISNGRELTEMIQRGFLEPLNPDARPNFDQYAAGWAKDPEFDVGNKYTMCWQSGLTGIAVNRDQVDREITGWNDLWDPAFAGKVGMLKDEIGEAAMLTLGIDIPTSTPDDWRKAQAKLLEQKDAGIVRQYYEQEYIDAVLRGDLAIAMAWSGDIEYYRLWEGYDNLEFIVPEEGALHWIDNMCFPKNVAHPVDAMTLADYVFDPKIATMIVEWVLYMSPVPETQGLIQADAESAYDKGWTGYAKKLEAAANNEFLYPSDELLASTSKYRELTTDQEAEDWNDIFVLGVIQA